jgi:Phosphotransferase enzyme family
MLADNLPNLPEAQLNLLVRRVDWRFLLPTPRVKRATCFAHGDLQASLALVADQVVEPQDVVAPDCDLAVAVDPDARTLEAALAVLRPGGWCYIEWTKPGSGGWWRLTSRLLHAGFERPRSYLTWRSMARVRAWVPLESAAATRYFQRQVPASHALPRLRARLARIVFVLAGKAGLVRPLSTLACKPGGAESDENAPTLLGLMRSDWSRLGRAGGPEEAALLMLTGGPRTGSKIAALVFAGSEPHPALLLKVARSTDAAEGLRREVRALRAVESRGRVDLAQTPRVIFATEDRFPAAIGETALVGVPLQGVVNRRNYRRFALQATDWLVGLANSSRVEDAPGTTQLVERTLGQFEVDFGPVLEAGLIRRAGDLLGGLERLPSIHEHRDFSPWNVFVLGDGRLAIFDWESSELQGLPALDLLYFLTYLAWALDAENSTSGVLRAWRTARDSSTLPGAVHRECTARYTKAVGLASGSVPGLALLTWMIHSRSEYRRLVGDAGGRPTLEALRGSLFFQLWKRELSESKKA